MILRKLRSLLRFKLRQLLRRNCNMQLRVSSPRNVELRSNVNRERLVAASASVQNSKREVAMQEDVAMDDHIPECPRRTDRTAECRCEVNGVFCICIICRRSLTRMEIKNREACPECDTHLRPIHPRNLVNVNINWEELMTLATWAEQYAAAYKGQYPDMLKAVYAITAELEDKNPMKSPLTVGRELGVMQEKNPTLPFGGGPIEPVPPKLRLQ